MIAVAKRANGCWSVEESETVDAGGERWSVMGVRRVRVKGG